MDSHVTQSRKYVKNQNLMIMQMHIGQKYFLVVQAEHTSGGNNKHMRLAEADCKQYIAEKFELKQSTIHTSAGTAHPGNVSVHIRIKSSHPLVEESGTCRVIDGDVSYKASN